MKSNVAYNNIAIVGGGLVGRLLAWRLASIAQENTPAGVFQDNGISSAKISLFEKGSLNPSLSQCDKAAAFTAAAMISPISELVESEIEIYQLGMKSLQLWPNWLKTLGSLQHFHQCGSLVLAHPSDTNELQQFKRDLAYKLHSQADASQLQVLADRRQLEELETSISAQFKNGLYLPSEAHIDHHEVLKDLVLQATKLGVQFHQNTALEPNDDALKEFDLIFDCRGFGLRRTDLNETATDTIRGVRGEVIRLECKDVILKRPIRLMHPRYKLYIVPKPNQQFIIGATEIESEDRSSISLRSSMELMSALYALNPAFAEARIISQDSNLRPAYMNNLPRIDRVQSTHGKPVIRINGLYRHGYLIAPAMIERALKTLDIKEDTPHENHH